MSGLLTGYCWVAVQFYKTDRSFELTRIELAFAQEELQFSAISGGQLKMALAHGTIDGEREPAQLIGRRYRMKINVLAKVLRGGQAKVSVYDGGRVRGAQRLYFRATPLPALTHLGQPDSRMAHFGMDDKLSEILDHRFQSLCNWSKPMASDPSQLSESPEKPLAIAARNFLVGFGLSGVIVLAYLWLSVDMTYGSWAAVETGRLVGAIA
ncbi:MAG: hypothetical protein AAFW95_06805, partial [Cyanobacteria bacterium J06638_6]